MINHDMLRWRLEELSNREEQERLWLGNSGGEMSSFTEAICGVFDDAGLTRAIESNFLQKNYSEAFCRKVNELDRTINSIPENSSPREIIDHPRMEQIRILASEILDMFSQKHPTVE
jgi:hypothetical protein